MEYSTDFGDDIPQPEAQIKLTFDIRTGETRIRAEGFKGPNCKTATEYLKSLGNVTDFTRKREWFETNLQLGGVLQTNLCG